MFTRKPIFCSTVRFLVPILFFAVAAVSGPPAHAQAVFSPSINLSSNYPGGSFGPQIALDSNGNIDVVWVEDNSAQPDNGVYFSRSTDGGLTFSTPISLQLNPGGYSFGRVWLALDSGGNIYVVCRLMGASGPGQVEFTHSTDGGASFWPRLTLSLLPSLDDPEMGIDSSGNINVIWSEAGNTGSSHVEFSRSTDGGNTFSAPKQITAEDAMGGSRNIFLVVDSNGGINVLWRGYSFNTGQSINFTRSGDGGVTFSHVNVFNGQFTYSCCASSAAPMAVDSSGNIYVAWWFASPDTALLSRSTDGGVTFSSPQPISQNSSFARPQIAIDAHDIIRVLGINRNSSPSILFTRSADAGSTFSTPQSIAPVDSEVDSVQSAEDSKGNIQVIWSDDLNLNNTFNNTEVFSTVSNDGGSTFSSSQNISNDPGYSDKPALALSSRDNAYIAWDGPTAQSSNSAILFSRSISFSSLILSSNTLSGGASTTGTVTLSGPAPSGGATIWMSSSDWNAAGPTDPVTIPEGATSAAFSVGTNSVSQTTSVTISGSYAGMSQSATLTVTPPVLTTESVSPASVIGGSSLTGTVTLDQPAPAGGIVVSLSSNNPGAASVPASVTVPQWSNTASFAITTSAVANTTSITITATSGSITQAASFTVTPATLVSLVTDVSSMPGGSGCTGMVQLNGPAPSGGAVIALGSSDPSTATVPASVTIPAGATSAMFPISAGDVSQPTSVTITAVYQGASQSVSLTVTP